MPVPKGKERIYGVIVGKNINEGQSLTQAKHIADKAMKDKTVNDKALPKGYGTSGSSYKSFSSGNKEGQASKTNNTGTPKASHGVCKSCGRASCNMGYH